jgi:chromosomal replication initiator protein
MRLLGTSGIWNEPDVTGAASGAAGTEQVATQWARIRGRLQADVGDVEYRTWLKQMTLAGIDGEEVTVHLPSRFLRDWVRSHYGEKITRLWQLENAAIRRVDIRVGHGRPGLAESLAEPLAPPVERAAAAARSTPPKNGSDERTAPLDPRFTFDSFVVGKPNEFAFACARRVAEQPSSAGFNPLFLYGGVGLGKTHLMHAIGLELARHAGPQKSVSYMSAETFMYKFIAAIRAQSTLEFKDQLRSVDVLMIDDLQFLVGKDNTQEEFFHTFNALVDAGKQIVVSADKSPSEISGLGDRLRTRLGCGMVADLHATTYELRISILEAKARRADAAVPGKVMEFLAHRITSNVRELEGALNRLIAQAGDAGDGAGSAARRAEGARQACHHRRNPEARGRALPYAPGRHDQRAARPRRRPAAPGGNVPGQATDQPFAAGNRQEIRQPRPHDRHARRLPRHRTDGHRLPVRRRRRSAQKDAGVLDSRAQKFFASFFSKKKKISFLKKAAKNFSPWHGTCGR